MIDDNTNNTKLRIKFVKKNHKSFFKTNKKNNYKKHVEESNK